MMSLSLSAFETFAAQTPAQVSRPRHYLKAQLLRLHETYRVASGLLADGASVLSVGAGPAFIECALARYKQAAVTVFDFPGQIEAHADQYAAHSFHARGGNFLIDDVGPELYDAVLFCEIVEHIPMPPAQQFAKLARYLKPGGLLIVSTPNVGSAFHLVALLRGKNVFASAERLFSPVGFENEGVHRREYTMAEIIEAMTTAGLAVRESRYIHQCPAGAGVLSRSLFAFTHLLPRWRAMMLLVGQCAPDPHGVNVPEAVKV